MTLRARLVIATVAAVTALVCGMLVVAVVSPAQEGCSTPDHVVVVPVSRTRWPQVADHVADVRERFPKILHVDRADADANRAASLRGLDRWGELTAEEKAKADPAHPAEPHDLDEQPPAMFGEGGTGADVRLVLSSENRSQGSVMGTLLSEFCDGSHVRLVAVR